MKYKIGFLILALAINIPAIHAASNTNKLPFVGKKGFNFYGGSGTEQSITISKNAMVTIMLYGTQSSEVIYKGKFTNPIIKKDGTGWLIKANKLYLLNKSKQIELGCQEENQPCVAEFY